MTTALSILSISLQLVTIWLLLRQKSDAGLHDAGKTATVPAEQQEYDDPWTAAMEGRPDTEETV